MSRIPKTTSPQYEKQPYAPQWEYHHMSWEIFLITREWAQEVATREGYPVYLVGSALWKPYPRDLDLSMLLPLDDFEVRYGEIPLDEEKRKGYLVHGRFYADAGRHQIVLQERLLYTLRVDFKIQPSAWFADRDRLLLAIPEGRVRVRDWTLWSIPGDPAITMATESRGEKEGGPA